jgi:DNA invertase Pin-like site-specific DNA recombinase
MRVKYNRISTLGQSGDRFSIDESKYDLVLLDKVSGSIPFMERPKGKEVVKLILSGQLKELTVEEFSRLGRNTGDVINTLEWLEKNEINVHIRNLGLQSRPNNKKNPVWKLISSILSSIYELELENIKERTAQGRQAFLLKGGVLGRPNNSTENDSQFLKKEKNQEIIKLLKKERTIREISKLLDVSNKTVIKVKKIAIKNGLLAA